MIECAVGEQQQRRPLYLTPEGVRPGRNNSKDLVNVLDRYVNVVSWAVTLAHVLLAIVELNTFYSELHEVNVSKQTDTI